MLTQGKAGRQQQEPCYDNHLAPVQLGKPTKNGWVNKVLDRMS